MRRQFEDVMFVETSSACPEQYDVFNEYGEQIGYVRLRWGGLTVKVPNSGGELIYCNSIGTDGYKGCFDNEEERMKYLEEIVQAIKEYYAGH